MNEKSIRVCRTRVYVWEFPVRLAHWINALSVFTLSFTGFYIGSPFIPVKAEPAYVMGWMRFVHLVSGYVLLSMFLLRLSWGFLGNRYANWRTWFPHTRQHWSDAASDLKYHLFIGRRAPYAVGHTMLGNIVYILIFAFMLNQVATGFALYAVNHMNLAHMLFGGWLLYALEIPTIRLFHHLAMYALLVFAAAHIYMAWYMDTVEKERAYHGPRDR
jgi:Ni/Fe-hydrogenase 1 B-type cytochrome subunit